MFELFKKKEVKVAPIPGTSEQLKPREDVYRKAWVVILEDGRSAYIDHYKINGKFGVRPVAFDNGLHYQNTSTHWTAEQRLTIPEELALTIHEFRAASVEEIPPMWRPR